LTLPAERHLNAWATVAGGLKVRVRLTPNSAQDRIAGIMAGAGGPVLKVRVRARAEKGAANAALTKVVAAWLGVPQGAVVLIAGAKTRTKTLLVTGAGPELAKRAATRQAQA
jgi:uncharacterized protein YggU (UPF0235/DUF167 family)